MSFYKKKNTTFKTGKLDIIVTTIVFIVFIWAFFYDSFIPMRNETGKIIYDFQGKPLIKINPQIIIGPIILLYEMMLMLLEGKPRGRYIQWNLYYQKLKYNTILKIREGKQITKEYKEENNIWLTIFLLCLMVFSLVLVLYLLMNYGIK
jgi:hypothetical protein